VDYASFRIQFGKLIGSHQLGQKLLAKEFTTSRMRETVAWCRELFGGNGIVMDYGVMKYFADAEAIYSYEGTREMNTLIVRRAITGKAAFV
jgi:glutaryl-CoA dehydrogenase